MPCYLAWLELIIGLQVVKKHSHNNSAYSNS
jgi:hypothetical protein